MFVNPIAFYNHSVGNSITGGYVYNGESDGLNGQYFYTDFGTHRLFTLRFDGTNWISADRTSQVQTNVGTINNPASFGKTPAAICTSSISTARSIGSRQPSRHRTSGRCADRRRGNDRLFGAPAPTVSTAGPGWIFSTAGPATTA